MELRRIPLMALVAALAALPLAPEGRLVAGDLYNDDNSIELHMGDDGIIDFMQVTENPGPSYMTRRGMDVVAEAWKAHGPGIVTAQMIKQVEAQTWSVACEGDIPATLRIAGKSVSLELGKETYVVTKPKDYLVEVRPRAQEGGSGGRFAYSVARNRQENKGFLGIIDRSYIPRCDSVQTQGIDWLAVTYPRDLTFGDDRIVSYVSRAGGREPPDAAFFFDYSVKMDGDKSVNLQNYLILLTRRGDNPYLFIHPVLLTLLYFDALTK